MKIEVGDWIVFKSYGSRVERVPQCVTKVTAQRAYYKSHPRGGDCYANKEDVIAARPFKEEAERLIERLQSSVALREQEQTASHRRHYARTVEHVRRALDKCGRA